MLHADKAAIIYTDCDQDYVKDWVENNKKKNDIKL